MLLEPKKLKVFRATILVPKDEFRRFISACYSAFRDRLPAAADLRPPRGVAKVVGSALKSNRGSIFFLAELASPAPQSEQTPEAPAGRPCAATRSWPAPSV